MKKIEVFETKNLDAKKIKAEKIESLLKSFKSQLVLNKVSGNESAMLGNAYAIAAALQLVWNEWQELLETTKKVTK